MKKNAISYICVLSLCLPSFCLPSYSYATGGVEVPDSSGGSVNKGSAVKDSADQTKKDNSSGAAMSYIMSAMETATGATMISSGMDSCPACNYGMIAAGVMMVGMGIMSAAQGSAHDDSANQAGNTGFSTDGYGKSRQTNSVDPKDPSLKAAKDQLAKLEKMGIYDSKAGTLKAGGKTYKVSDFASESSMAAAGLPKGAIDGAMAMNAELEKKARDKFEKLKLGALTAGSGFDESGGKGAAPEELSTENSSPSLHARTGAAVSGRDPSSLAGMQKNYNGEPIGVAGDDIFNMMKRRYQVKENQESFLTEAELALKK